MISDDAGTQKEVARRTGGATDVNVGTSVDGALDFGVITAGTLVKEVRLESLSGIRRNISDKLLTLRKELEKPLLDDRMTQFLRGQIIAYSDIENLIAESSKEEGDYGRNEQT